VSWRNEEKCIKLREAGVQLNQAGYKSFDRRGKPTKHSLEERNDIKKICLKCILTECVYERTN